MLSPVEGGSCFSIVMCSCVHPKLLFVSDTVTFEGIDGFLQQIIVWSLPQKIPDLRNLGLGLG